MNNFLLCARILAGLILYSSTAHSLNCWVHKCTSPVKSKRNYFTLLLLSNRLLQSSHSFAHDGLWAIERGCGVDITFVTEHSTVTYSLHFDLLWNRNILVLFVSAICHCDQTPDKKKWMEGVYFGSLLERHQSSITGKVFGGVSVVAVGAVVTCSHLSIPEEIEI